MSAQQSPESDRSAPTINRRRLLAAAGAGVPAVGAAALPAAARGDHRATVTTPNPLRRFRLTRRALADERVDQLVENLRVEGWYRDRGAAIHQTTQPDGPDYTTVAIPFARSSDDAQAVVLWTDDGPFPVQTRRFIPDGNAYRMASTMVDEAGLRRGTGQVEPAFIWFFCFDINWTCVLSIAGAWAGTASSCASCLADPSRLSCLSCAGSILSALGTTVGCSICE